MQWSEILLSATAVTIILGIGVVLAFVPSYQTLSPLNQRRKDIYIDLSPNRLSSFDVFLLILLFVSRSISQTIFGTPKRKDQDAELSLSMPLLTGPGDVRDYAVAAMAGDTPEVPPPGHLLLMMLCVSEATMLLVLGKQDIPILPLGAVNVRNRFELLDSERCHQALQTKLMKLTSKATLLSGSRQMKRGREYDIRLEILTPDETGTKDICIFRLTFTMLQFGKSSEPRSKEVPAEQKVEEKVISTKDSPALTSFKLTANDPDKWAIACKDYNPIHIYTFAAKLFGFPGKIAHGNHVVAKAFHALSRSQSNNSSKMSKLWFQQHSKPIWMEVAFKRPVAVPNELQVRSIENASGKDVSLDIYEGEKVYTEVRSGFL